VLQLQYVVCVNSSPYASSKDGTCGGGVVNAAAAAAAAAAPAGGGTAACGAIEVATEGRGAEAGWARALTANVVSGPWVDCGFGDGAWE